MPNQIERDVYVLQSKVKNPIEYVRLTNAIPIIFHFRDYDIPESSSAEVYVQKPSGKAVFDDASISGNDVTVTVTDQMFAELGFSELQIKITENAQELVTFSQPVIAKPNYTEGDADQSQNEGGFFDEAQEALDDVKEASEKASEAVQSAQTAVENANKAVSDAQTAVSNAQEAANAANEAAQGIDTKVQQAVDSAVTTEALQPAVNNYFDSNPVLVDCTPTVEGTTLVFPNGISPTPGANIEQDVANLKQFAGQFDGKTLYTE